MIIGLCGKLQHGKSTVATILVEEFGFVEMAFADGVRAMAEAIDPYVEQVVEHKGSVFHVSIRYTALLARVGYEQAKQHPDVRRLLQRIGTEAGRQVLGRDVWVNALFLRVNGLVGQKNIVISDVRFPNEASLIEDLGGALVRVERPGMLDAGDMHESERHAMEMPVSSIIENKGTLDELRAQVRALYASSVEGGF